MNKQSNIYTVIYIIVLVALVGSALACTALALRDRQQENAAADKMKQILASAMIVPENGESVVELYREHIVEQLVVDSEGQIIPGVDAFSVNVSDQARVAADKRQLPVFVCRVGDGSLKYILPAYGAGLWGPIWGYVAVDADGSTVYGAFFAHQGETPGLGAEIEKPAFSGEFRGKELFKNGRFLPIAVVKAGQKPQNGEDYVDGISGGTITSKGVGSMLSNCLAPYENYLKSLQAK